VGASILCSLLLTGDYSARRNAKYFDYSRREVVFGWLQGLMRLSAFLIPLALLTWCVCLSLPVKWRLVCDFIVIGIGGGLLWLRYGIPAEIQAELLAHLPSPFTALLGKVFLRQDA
jgi:hypothetical protein